MAVTLTSGVRDLSPSQPPRPHLQPLVLTQAFTGATQCAQLWGHRVYLQLILLCLTQGWHPGICECAVLDGLHSSDLFGIPQLCYTSRLRVSSQRSTPGLFLGCDFRSLSLNTQSPLTTAGTRTSVSDWGVLVGTDLCAEFFPLCLPCICCCASL